MDSVVLNSICLVTLMYFSPFIFIHFVFDNVILSLDMFLGFLKGSGGFENL